MAVVGNEADAGVAKRAGPVARDLDILDADLAAEAAIDAGGGADEFALALAFDAGEADDLAGMDDEIDLVEAAAAQSLTANNRRADRLSPWPGKSGRAAGRRSARRSRPA